MTRLHLLGPDGEKTVALVAIRPDGPYEPHAFLAGWDCASIMHALHMLKPTTYSRRIYKALAEQIDLIAMEAGYTMRTLPVRGSELDVLAIFAPGDTTPPGREPVAPPL